MSFAQDSDKALGFDKARDYAFRLLKFRMRSRQELRSRLKKKKFDPATIERVVDFLAQRKFLDDREFARAWVRERIKRPFGVVRISRELKLKGIDKNIISDTLADLGSDYDEVAVVAELAKARSARLSGLEPKKAKARLYAYLLRRGFSTDAILEAIKQSGTEK